MARKAERTTEPRITKNTLISEALELCPEALTIMFEHGLHCVGCEGAAFETIEQGCQVHGMNEEEIDTLVEEINHSLGRKGKRK